MDWDRYFYYRKNGQVDQIPFVKIPVTSTDRYEAWEEGVSRLDSISKRFYGSPLYDVVILQANPQYLFEFDIPHGAIIRIPFPLEPVLRVYDESLKKIRNF
jgi:hypothetical protein